MRNTNILITAKKNLAKAFMPSTLAKIEYTSNVSARREESRSMYHRLNKIGIAPIYDSVTTGYTIPLYH